MISNELFRLSQQANRLEARIMRIEFCARVLIDGLHAQGHDEVPNPKQDGHCLLRQLKEAIGYQPPSLRSVDVAAPTDGDGNATNPPSD